MPQPMTSITGGSNGTGFFQMPRFHLSYMAKSRNAPMPEIAFDAEYAPDAEWPPMQKCPNFFEIFSVPGKDLQSIGNGKME